MSDRVSAAFYECGELIIRPATRELLREGDPVEVEGKVFDLIALLAASRERALDKQQVIEALWGRRPITDAALSQLIYKARRACGDDGERQAVIRTIYGRGLQWVAATREVAPAAPETAPHASTGPQAAPARATEDQRPASRMRRIRWAAAMVVIVVLAIGIGWRLVPRGIASDVPGAPRVALLPIENSTGDASLDWTVRGLPGLMGSLLDQSPALAVVDPLQVARAWDYTPARGEARADHVRAVTNASILVGGTLRKLADLYELTVHVEPGNGHAADDMILTGGEPGALAVAAASRVRGALKLQVDAPSAPGPTPEDAYLAQTFARGMDAATHGRWVDASPYFALVAKGDPDFLPGRYRLGQAQLRTGHADAAATTLRDVCADAERRHAPQIAALALNELAYRAILRHAFADALTLIDEAMAFAERAHAPEIRAELALRAAQAQSSLKHGDAAARSLAEARALIERHHLRQMQPALYRAEVFAADSRSDYRTVEQAARAALAANQALGDERGSTTSLYNIAYAMENQDRRIEALPLWAQVWTWARDHQDYDLQSGAAWYLASGLFNTGLFGPAGKVNGSVLEAARRQGDRLQQSLALRVQAGLEWMRGDVATALRTAREASALIDADNDPSSKLDAWSPEAFVALTAEPAAVAAIAQRADALVAAQPDPSAHRFRQRLLHALRAAAADDVAAARAALADARTAAAAESEIADVRQYAMNIALATGDPESAALALRDLDFDHVTDAVLLYLSRRWAAKRGDPELGQRVARRQSTLRDAAGDALRKAGADTALAIVTDTGG